MQKIISYPITAIFAIFFLACLVIFQPIQWICFNLFGYQAHKKSVDYLNFFLLRCSNILGNTYVIRDRELIPKNTPIIFVSNHQSMYDIPTIIWYFRRCHPKFVSKKELGKGIPSISYNLKHGGSVLVDRKDPKQAIPTIKGLGNYIQKHNRSAVIFPEGTRSRNGKPKKFYEGGLRTLCESATDAIIVPLTINNSWKMWKYGKYPLGLGSKIEVIVHQPLAVKDYSFEELFKETEKRIKSDIK